MIQYHAPILIDTFLNLPAIQYTDVIMTLICPVIVLWSLNVLRGTKSPKPIEVAVIKEKYVADIKSQPSQTEKRMVPIPK